MRTPATSLTGALLIGLLDSSARPGPIAWTEFLDALGQAARQWAEKRADPAALIIDGVAFHAAEARATLPLDLPLPLRFQGCTFLPPDPGDETAVIVLRQMAAPALSFHDCIFDGVALSLQSLSLGTLALIDCKVGQHLSLQALRLEGDLRIAGLSGFGRDSRPRLSIDRVQLRGRVEMRFRFSGSRSEHGPPGAVALHQVEAGGGLIAASELEGAAPGLEGFAAARLAGLSLTDCVFRGTVRLHHLLLDENDDPATPETGSLRLRHCVLTEAALFSDLTVPNRLAIEGCELARGLRLDRAPRAASGRTGQAPELWIATSVLASLSVTGAAETLADDVQGNAADIGALVLDDLRINGDLVLRQITIARDSTASGERAESGSSKLGLRRVTVTGQWIQVGVVWQSGLKAQAVSVAGGMTFQGCRAEGLCQFAFLTVQGQGVRIAGKSVFSKDGLILAGARLSALVFDPEDEAAIALPKLDLSFAQIGQMSLTLPSWQAAPELGLAGLRFDSLRGFAEDLNDDAAARAQWLLQRLKTSSGQASDKDAVADAFVAALTARGELEVATELAILCRRLRLAERPPEVLGKLPSAPEWMRRAALSVWHPIPASITGSCQRAAAVSSSWMGKAHDFADWVGRHLLDLLSHFGFRPWRAVAWLGASYIGFTLLWWLVLPTGWPCSALHYALINLLPGTGLVAPQQCLPAKVKLTIALGPVALDALGLVQRIFGGVLVALAALGFAGVLRPKGPKP